MHKPFFCFALAALFLTLCGCGAEKVPSLPAAAPATAAPVVTAAPSPRVIPADEAKKILDAGGDYLLLDVRDRDEYETGHIAGAVCIPYTELESRAAELPADHGTTVLVYCRSGRRSAIAAQTLASMGYGNVLDFGGILDWPYATVGGAGQDDGSCEHRWEVLDCLQERCALCGRVRNYE